MMNRNNLLLALTLSAALPVTALAHVTSLGGALRFGAFESHAALAGASANMPGLRLGVGGLYRGVDIRARVSYARGDGASLETFGVRAVASPRAVLSPYLSAGMIDLASLTGATGTATAYSVNPTTGVITPTITTTDLPPRGVVMGVAFVGLRARVALNPRWALAAHAALGAGIGGSVTGLPSTTGSRSPFAMSMGVGMRYRVGDGSVVALTYTREVVPVRGATFRSSGVSLTMARTFQ